MTNLSGRQRKTNVPEEKTALYRKCVTEKSASQQKQITESLLALMQTKPFAEITVTQLCQHAGVSRRSFYYLFSNLNGALYALLDSKILSEEIGGKAKALDFFRYWKQQKALLDALDNNDMLGLLLERMLNRLLLEDYDVHSWLHSHGWKNNNRELIIFGFTGLMGLVYGWYYDGYQQTPEQLAAFVDDMMTLYTD